MSAVIRQLVARKRMVDADRAAFEARRDQIIEAAKGEKGDKGDPGPMPDHEWKGTKLRFTKPDGTWGKFKEVRGPKGDDGKQVVVVAGGGGGGAGLDVLPPASSGEPQAVAVLMAGAWVKLSWPAFMSVVAGAIDMGTPMSRRTDFVGTTVIYSGEAAPGALESAEVWRIRRFTFSPDGDTVEQFAGGTSDFVHAWDDRAALDYS